jgi:hypothetical protein
MLFELKALIIFQKLINDTLKKYLNDFVITYLNNIMIYSEDLKTHCKHVCKILKKLKKSFVCEKLKANLKFRKSDF